MSDLDYDLSDPNAGATAPRRKAAPKAAAGLSDAQFKAYLADPTTIPEDVGISKSGMTPEQQRQLRQAWPILTRQTTTEDSGPETARANRVRTNLDNLLTLGQQVYSGKIAPETSRAISEHFDWVRSKEHRGEGAGTDKALQALAGTSEDPLSKIKNAKEYERARAAVKLVNLLGDTKAAGDATAPARSPYEIISTHLPGEHDAPSNVAQKRRDFATEIEEIAQGLPSQYWRAAVKHTLRARALAGDGTSGTNVPKVSPAAGAPRAFPFSGVPEGGATPAPPPDKVAPYGLSGVVTGETRPQEDMGLPEAVGRAALHGGTSLSMPVMAAIAHSVSTTGDVPLGEGMTQFVPDAVAEQPTSYAQTLDTGRRLIGDDPEKLAQARDKLGPVGSFAAELAGGFADPTTYALGPMGKVIGESTKLSAPARAVLAHAVGGAFAGGLGAASEGGDAGSGALLGAATGGAAGAGMEHLLNSPAAAKAIKGVAQKFADEMGGTTAEVEAKESALRAAALGSPEMRAVVAGNKKVAEGLGPKLVDARDALIERTGGGALKSMMVKAERAADAGETKAVEAAHAQFRKIAQTAKTPEAKSLATGLDELLTKRELLSHVRSSLGGHGSSGGVSHPLAQLASGNATPAEVAAAAVREAGEGRGQVAVGAFLAGKLKSIIGPPARTTKQALARLYLARQTGDVKLIHEVAEQAIRVGVPYSLARQVAEQAGAVPGHWERSDEP